MYRKLTKKQVKDRLSNITESKVDLNEVKADLESAYSSLKKAKQKIKDSNDKDNKGLAPLKKAMRFLSDELDEMEDITKSEEVEEEEQAVVDKNEQSEGYGKMFNALKGSEVRENKVITLNQSTLKRIVERVIKEQEKNRIRKLRNESYEDYRARLNEEIDFNKFPDGTSIYDMGMPVRWEHFQEIKKYIAWLKNYSDDEDKIELYEKQLELDLERYRKDKKADVIDRDVY